MEIIYKAFDGKIFDNEYKCQNYETEKALEEYRKSVKLLDSYGKPIPLTQDGLVECFFINIKNEKFLKWIPEQRFSLPQNIGIYYYNDKDDRWENLDNKIDELKENLSFLIGAKEKLEE